MKLTGSNTLYTPRVSQVFYLMKDIVVDTTGRYSVVTRQSLPYATGSGNSTNLFSLVSGIVLDPSGRFVSTYNTGEPFSLSGWLDYASNGRFFSAGNEIMSRTPELTSTTGLLAEWDINCPTSGSMICDLQLLSYRITETVRFSPNMMIRTSLTGTIATSSPMFVNDDTFQFYQSYENLLTGSPLLAFIDDRFPNDFIYYDNDSTNQNNTFNGNYSFGTTYKQVITPFTIDRTGLYSSGINQLVDVSETGAFSGAFDGVWSGDRFIYQDTANSLTLSYYVNRADAQGLTYPFGALTYFFYVQAPATLRAEYITGFQLTNSGIYQDPPLIACTGYYYCTGIQQSLNSLLFTTGCTGNIHVTFSGGGGGSGASGQIQLQPVLFSGVYVNGQRWYNVASAYITTNIGTGYTLPPKAYINTGMYGTQCYDVPRASGYNQAWFSPFDTSGTMTIEAGWFTGVAMYTTGITGNGLTGIIVTGIDVYNIGTGYSNARPPRLSFIRTGSTMGGANNASGILYMKTGTTLTSGISYEYSIGGATWLPTGYLGTIPSIPDNNHYVNFRISISGSDATVPISGTLQVTSAVAGSVFSRWTYSKYFDTGADALKKKDSVAQTFEIGSDLSFLLTQNELDTLYSTAGYTNNNWPFSEGDFDF